MPTTVLAVAAASWSVVMALAPLLQLRRMLGGRSSDDVSIGYLVLLLPGFCLWVSYGIASGDTALLIPNSAAAVRSHCCFDHRCCHSVAQGCARRGHKKSIELAAATRWLTLTRPEERTIRAHGLWT